MSSTARINTIKSILYDYIDKFDDEHIRGLYVNSLPGHFSPTGLKTAIDYLVRDLEKTLNRALGLSLAEGRTLVTENDVIKAIEFKQEIEDILRTEVSKPSSFYNDTESVHSDTGNPSAE